jgi:hypothetical protein
MSVGMRVRTHHPWWHRVTARQRERARHLSLETEIDHAPGGGSLRIFGSPRESCRIRSSRTARAAAGSEATSLEVAYRSARRSEGMT